MSANQVFRLTTSALISVAILSPAAFAEETVIDAGTVVITPNRSATDKDKVGSKVEVVTEEEIEETQFPEVTYAVWGSPPNVLKPENQLDFRTYRFYAGDIDFDWCAGCERVFFDRGELAAFDALEHD